MPAVRDTDGVSLRNSARHSARNSARLSFRAPAVDMPRNSARQSNSQGPQLRIVHASCPHCHITNQLMVPNSSDHLAFQCGSCAHPFRLQISLPPARDICVCRSCGSLNTYELPGVGMPFPPVSCGVCGHILQRQGNVTERARQRAEFWAQSMDGPNVMVAVRGLRQPVPLRFLQALEMHAEADDDLPPENPASSADIAALPVQRVGSATHLKEQTCCMICLEKFKDGDELKTLPCLHMFHSGCIHLWLKQNNSCPICKTPVGPTCQGNFCSHSSK